MRDLRITAGMLVLALGASGCQRDGGRDDRVAVDTVTTMESPALTMDLLSPIRAVSMVNVDFAQTGWQQASAESVRQFARTVSLDHRALIAVLDSVARTRDAILQETPEARELAQSIRMSHAGLDNLEEADYDLAFVRAQVESHRRLVDTIDQQLVPTAVSEDMRQLLRDSRAMVDAHLTRARQLLGDLLGEEVEPPPVGAPGTPGAAGTPGAPAGVPQPAPVQPAPQPTQPPDTVAG